MLTTEKMSLAQILSDVDLFVNLTALNLFHVKSVLSALCPPPLLSTHRLLCPLLHSYGSYLDYTWIADPSLLTADTIPVLAAPTAPYRSEPDFASRVLLWMTNYRNKAQRMIGYYQNAADKGQTHANGVFTHLLLVMFNP